LPRSRSIKLLGERFDSLVSTWHFLGAYAIATLVMALILPFLSHILTVSTIPLSAYVMTWTMKNLSLQCRHRLRPIYIRSMGAGALGFTFWLVDRFACTPMQTLLGFNPQFHAVWHMLIFIAGHYYAILIVSVVLEETKTPYRFNHIICKQLVICEVVHT